MGILNISLKFEGWGGG